MMSLRRVLLALFVLALFIPAYVHGQPAVQTPEEKEKEKRLAEVKANYTKYEYRIPMRDGTRLFTAVYVPKDQSQTYPMLMTRTPYNVKPYGVDQYKDTLGPSPV